MQREKVTNTRSCRNAVDKDFLTNKRSAKPDSGGI